jgi:excisionase family DNA binding protein
MERLLSIKEVSELLGLTPRRVHALVREGKLGCVQHDPRHRAFTESQVQDYIRSRTITPPPKVVDSDRRTCLQPFHVKLESVGGKSELRALLREEMASW